MCGMSDKTDSRIRGAITALVTPMLMDGQVDYAKLGDLIDWQIDSGIHALVAVGTTGESATLTVSEHAKTIEFFVKRANGRIPIIAGTGANSTHEAIELTQHAKDAGADYALLVTPYYNKPTQEGMYQHYKTIAEKVDIPQLLYNVPSRTGVDLHNDTIVRLSQIDNIVGVKEATGDLVRDQALLKALDERFLVLSGDDATALALTKMGADGVISVTSNILPDIMSQVYELALAGQFEQAFALESKIAHLHQDLFVESNPIPVKYTLWRTGRIDAGIRLPLTWLTKGCQSFIDESLAKAGIVL